MFRNEEDNEWDEKTGEDRYESECPSPRPCISSSLGWVYIRSVITPEIIGVRKETPNMANA